MTRRSFQNSGLLMLLSAVLHLVAIGAGSGAYWMPLVIGGAIMGALGWLLFAERRWTCYVAYLFALGGGCIALAMSQEVAAPFSYVLWAIVAVDWCAAFILYALIWRPADSA